MTRTELERMTQRYIELGGYTDTDLPPVYTELVNEAYQVFSHEVGWREVTATFNTVQNQAEYNLETVTGAPEKFLYLLDVMYGADVALTETTEDRIRQSDSRWVMAAAAVPVWYWISSINTLRLHPKPSVGSVAITIRGVREEQPLSTAGSIPAIPVKYHRSVARLAAYLHLEAFATGDEAGRAAEYYAKYAEDRDEFKSMLGAQDGPIIRTVYSRRMWRVSK